MKAPTLKDIKATYDKRHPERLDLGDGFYAVVELPCDSDHGAPWEECDGHGPVSEWTRRAKRPGEWTLSSDRGSKRYYDFAEAVKIARKDGWGLCPKVLAKLTVGLGRPPTKGEIAVAAVERDFEILRGWANDEWHYVGVCVKIFDSEDEEVWDGSVWGVEDNTGYWKELALEFIQTGIDELDTEACERTYWECRDVETLCV